MALARNPLGATLIAAVHSHRGQLPGDRAKLYGAFIDLMVVNWPAAGGRSFACHSPPERLRARALGLGEHAREPSGRRVDHAALRQDPPVALLAARAHARSAHRSRLWLGPDVRPTAVDRSRPGAGDCFRGRDACRRPTSPRRGAHPDLIQISPTRPERTPGESWQQSTQQHAYIEPQPAKGVRLTTIHRRLSRPGTTLLYSTLHQLRER
jgi:hypothetical protein